MTGQPLSPAPPETFAPLAAAAEQVLSEFFGRPIRFTQIDRLSEPDRRNLLLRCRLSETGDTPASLIIKKVEAEASDLANPDSWHSRRFFSDWIGSQFLSALGSGARHGPRFYGGNRERGFIILEDLGPHRSLVEPLLHENAASAERSLLRYSARLGQMHAQTANQYAAFAELANRINPGGPLFADDEGELQRSFQQVQTSLAALGIAAEAGLAQELNAIVAQVAHPGPFLAYLHGDPCPDNVFDLPDHMRLIDFEFGYFGHALLDATYARMIFPTCWCANRVPPALVEAMERRHRAELILGCPAAQDDAVFEQALVTICGLRVLGTLSRHLDGALSGDDEWGIATIRQRILARLEAFMAASAAFGQFPALRGTSGRLHERLAERWPATAPLPLYPAFSSQML